MSHYVLAMVIIGVTGLIALNLVIRQAGVDLSFEFGLRGLKFRKSSGTKPVRRKRRKAGDRVG